MGASTGSVNKKKHEDSCKSTVRREKNQDSWNRLMSWNRQIRRRKLNHINKNRACKWNVWSMKNYLIISTVYKRQFETVFGWIDRNFNRCCFPETNRFRFQDLLKELASSFSSFSEIIPNFYKRKISNSVDSFNPLSPPHNHWTNFKTEI